MKLIIENNGQRREISSAFKIYGSAEDLKLIQSAIEGALVLNLGIGWVEVGQPVAPVNTTPFPWAATADEKPVYPWVIKTG